MAAWNGGEVEQDRSRDTGGFCGSQGAGREAGNRAASLKKSAATVQLLIYLKDDKLSSLSLYPQENLD